MTSIAISWNIQIKSLIFVKYAKKYFLKRVTSINISWCILVKSLIFAKYAKKNFFSRANSINLTHTGEKRHFCEICNKGFSQKCNLNQHLLHILVKKPHIGEICKKWFSVKIIRNKHLLTHIGENPDDYEIDPVENNCLVCNRPFIVFWWNDEWPMIIFSSLNGEFTSEISHWDHHFSLSWSDQFLNKMW